MKHWYIPFFMCTTCILYIMSCALSETIQVPLIESNPDNKWFCMKIEGGEKN